MPDPSVDDTELMRSALAEFDRLSDLDQTTRDATLAGLSAANPKLHARVLSLFRAARDANSAGFLLGNAEQMLASSAAEPASDLAPGIAFGAYRLERQLGAGGMGEVWLGRRSDGLFEGVVAIKTLHAHLSGPAIRARFAREGQFLGRLSHPQIARLLDAGVSPDGTLFLVLEYVDGLRLDQWCDEHRLDIESRLRLILDVCAAVSHAHSHLVVHRDLKPSNILVTAQGEVKLLDFGIAKLIEVEGAAQTDLTRIGGRALTPEYAAPEQVLGSPISAATDVYALGVLVYGLLSGARPYGARRSTVAQIERDVLETEPLPLGQMAAHAVPGEQSPAERAANRSSTPRQLRKRLKGDLEIIVGQALKKRPEERYSSVATFAADLRRHLKHEPITARPDSLAYRSAKFVRRYRTGVAAAAVVALVLIAGLSASLWQAELARQEARRADAEARKAGAVKDFLIDIFQRNEAGVSGGGEARNTTAEQLLKRGAQRIRERLDEAPEVRAELLGTIGGLYRDLLLEESAIGLLREQVELLRRSATDDAGRRRLAAALVDLGAALSNTREREAGQGLLEEALHLFDALGDTRSLDRVTALVALGFEAFWTGSSVDDTAQRRFSEALAIAEQHHPLHALRVSSLVGLAHTADARGDLALAEQYLRQAVALGSLPGFVIAPGRLAQARQMLGSNLLHQRRLAAALPELRAALAISIDGFGPDSLHTAQARQSLAMALAESGERAEAQQLLQEALIAATSASANQEDDIAPNIALDLGWVLYQRGLPDAAAIQLEPLLERYAQTEPWLHVTLTRLARVRLAQGRVADVRSLLDRARPLLLRDRGEHSFAHANFLQIEAELALHQQHAPVAILFLQQADRVWSSGDATALGIHELRLAWNSAWAQIDQNQAASAAAGMRVLLERIRSSLEAPLQIDEEAWTRHWLGLALRALDQPAQACEELRRAVELRKSLDDPASVWLARTRREYASCLRTSRGREAQGARESALCCAPAQG